MVTRWHGCYADSWQGVIVPDAFAHPAKFSRGLIRRIYEHMLARGYIAPGDSVVDPFGGVGLGGLDAMTLGLHWTGVELEPRFVELGQRNLEKWRRDLAMLDGRLGTARLLQGDSRRLLAVAGAAAMSDSYFVRPDGRPFGEGPVIRALLGDTPGQLGTMPAGDYAAAVSSPPYATGDRGHPSLGSVNKDAWGRDGRDIANRRGLSAEYGSTPGQLADMSEGRFDAAVSSPPYADAVNGTGEGPGARHDPIYHNGDNAYKASSANGYGKMPGNIGADTGETFWAAARVIVKQTYAALRPGGHAAWVTKDFVRGGQRVPFSDQWQALCEAVGFAPVERIAALLVDDHGDQLDIFGGAVARCKERKSFFRRLAEKKGSPRIDHEDVIIMRRPFGAESE